MRSKTIVVIVMSLVVSFLWVSSEPQAAKVQVAGTQIATQSNVECKLDANKLALVLGADCQSVVINPPEGTKWYIGLSEKHLGASTLYLKKGNKENDLYNGSIETVTHTVSGTTYSSVNNPVLVVLLIHAKINPSNAIRYYCDPRHPQLAEIKALQAIYPNFRQKICYTEENYKVGETILSPDVLSLMNNLVVGTLKRIDTNGNGEYKIQIVFPNKIDNISFSKGNFPTIPYMNAVVTAANESQVTIDWYYFKYLSNTCEEACIETTYKIGDMMKSPYDVEWGQLDIIENWGSGYHLDIHTADVFNDIYYPDDGSGNEEFNAKVVQVDIVKQFVVVDWYYYTVQ